MKKAVVLPIVAAVSGALLGCGGGGGGTPPPPEYQPKNVTWTFVEPLRLTEEEYNKPEFKNCSIYFEHIAEDEFDESVYVIARLATRQYKVLFHESNGDVIADKTWNPSVTNSSSFTFDWKQIPDGGYVSIEEFGETLGANGRQSFITAFEKPLVQNMTLSVRSSQDGNGCITNEQFKGTTSDEFARVGLSTNGRPLYFQTSGSQMQVSGGDTSTTLSTPVSSDLPAQERKLATAFANYDGHKYDDFISYAIFGASDIFSSEDVNSKPAVSMDSNSHEVFSVIVDDEVHFQGGSVNVVLDGQIYNWQEIFEQSSGITDTAFVPSEAELSHWSVLLEGYSSVANGEWEMMNIHAVTESRDVIFSENVDLSLFNASTITASCQDSDLCADLEGYYQEDWDLQRTHIRTKTIRNQDAFQTIYALPNANQPLMASEAESFELDPSDNILVTLASSEGAAIEDLALFVAESSFDIEVLSNGLIDPASHKFDVNGLVLGQNSKRELFKKIMNSQTQKVENSINW